MRKVWLIRHAESQANAGKVTDSPHSIALSQLGHSQAAELAEGFATPPDLIVVSKYQRTVDTARPTMERFSNVPVLEWPLHEFTFLCPAHYGGQTQADRLGPATAFWDKGDAEHCDGEGAESFNDFMGRVRECLERLRNASEQFIAVFTHGYVMKAMLWKILYRGDRSPNQFMAAFRAFHRSYPVLNGMIVPMTVDKGKMLFAGAPMVMEAR